MTIIRVDGVPAPQGSKIRTRYGMRAASKRVGQLKECADGVGSMQIRERGRGVVGVRAIGGRKVAMMRQNSSSMAEVCHTAGLR